MKSAYRFVKETFEKHDTSFGSPMWNRAISLRALPSVHRVERPTNVSRARKLGYKAKQGYIVISVRVRRGTLHKLRPILGRKNANLAVRKITPKKSIQRIAEERAQRRYMNCEVLNSYHVISDGRNHYYEVILVDRTHPAIKADKNINWVARPANYRRVFRGKTSAGRKGRGITIKKRGTEKNFPSLRAHNNRGK